MEDQKNIKGWLQPLLVILLVLAAFALGSMWTELRVLKSSQTAVQPTPTAEQNQPVEEPTELTEELWQEIIKDPAAVKGSETAAVTLVEFTDYECPFCKRYAEETMPQLEKEYVETGKIRYILRDLPLEFHPSAHLAAEAAKCAGVQGKYFEYHNALFADQETWSQEAAAEATVFSAYAKNLGLDTTKFDSCLANGEQKAAVDSDSNLAQKIGIGGTPSFVINTKILVGAQPYEQFKAAIDAALE